MSTKSPGNEFWPIWAFYNKNPIFFKPKTPEVYIGNFETYKFNLVNKLNFNMPLNTSKCELPDGSIFITGGDNIGDILCTTLIYSPHGIVNQRNNMNFARKLHSSIYFEGFVYVFGGYNGSNIFGSVERYDLQNDCWKVIGQMAENRAYSSILRYGKDYIFIIGGACTINEQVILL